MSLWVKLIRDIFVTDDQAGYILFMKASFETAKASIYSESKVHRNSVTM